MTTHQGDISGRLLCRRAFLSCAAGSTLGLTLGSRIQASETLPAGDPSRAGTLTRPPGHHFFGYYDKCPWDRTGRYVLGMRSDFMDRQPRPGEELTIGLIDTRENDRFVPLDRTPAWSWQQGTMLQWLGPAADRRMIYNSLDGDRYVSIVRDVRSGETRRLPRPIYAVSRDGRQAVTLDFDRVNRMRPGYGYVALPERCADQPAPAEAGIYWMDLDRGDSRLILSIAWAAAHRPDERFDGAAHWFNHLQFNPSGTRFIFLHRWRTAGGNRWWTRLYTAAPDGSDVRLLSDAGMVSHFDWRTIAPSSRGHGPGRLAITSTGSTTKPPATRSSRATSSDRMGTARSRPTADGC